MVRPRSNIQTCYPPRGDNRAPTLRRVTDSGGVGALRLLLPLASFRARTPDELYEALRRLDWRQWMRPTDTFAFDAVVYSDTFTHSRYVGYRAKDALVDYFMEQEGTRPGVRLDNPDLRFHIHIAQEEVTLALDSSGESLHKRGWRAAQTEAPMSEVLAAGILRLAGWEGQRDFIDPMCGSGTSYPRPASW